MVLVHILIRGRSVVSPLADAKVIQLVEQILTDAYHPCLRQANVTVYVCQQHSKAKRVPFVTDNRLR